MIASWTGKRAALAFIVLFAPAFFGNNSAQFGVTQVTAEDTYVETEYDLECDDSPMGLADSNEVIESSEECEAAAKAINVPVSIYLLGAVGVYPGCWHTTGTQVNGVITTNGPHRYFYVPRYVAGTPDVPVGAVCKEIPFPVWKIILIVIGCIAGLVITICIFACVCAAANSGKNKSNTNNTAVTAQPVGQPVGQVMMGQQPGMVAIPMPLPAGAVNGGVNANGQQIVYMMQPAGAQVQVQPQPQAGTPAMQTGSGMGAAQPQEQDKVMASAIPGQLATGQLSPREDQPARYSRSSAEKPDQGV